MSNIATTLLKGRGFEVSDGVYLERDDPREPVLEEYLRALIARLPKPGLRASRLRKFIEQANAIEQEMRALTDEELVERFKTHCLGLRKTGFVYSELAPAFAAIREGSRRTLGLRHHDVQLIGGWALLQGMISEMETGEGKTLVATLAACTAAAAGAAVHVITVNDYLAERDAKKNEPLYRFFNLSLGIVIQGMEPAERRAQYGNDIVYVSNKEIVFDYLKDRIATGGAMAAHHCIKRLHRPEKPLLLLRGLHVAIVDEADSVLVDEARTPLIISETQPDELGTEVYQTAIERAERMVQGEHFQITAHREVWMTTKGEEFLHELTADLSGLWTSPIWRRELLEKALSALWCFQRDQHYIVADEKVQIVDEFTGRVMPDRSWERGLHQMIEAKEGCEITGQRKTLSRMTYQRFFRRYLLLCGMTGTATEVEPELRRVYDLEVFKIPTHKPNRRKWLGSFCWLITEQRWEAVVERAAELGRAGRAVLIGTRSVEASEHLSVLLAKKGIQHTVLNARQDREEAEIVAEAGQPGRITVATNMAGRGTDIQLAPEVSEKGGLHVILTEFHESTRVDRQLYGRCARQGEPGSVETLVSLQDEIFERYAPLLTRLAEAFALRRGAVPGWLLGILVRVAQSAAERHNARIRFSTLKQDRKLQALLAFSGTPS